MPAVWDLDAQGLPIRTVSAMPDREYAIPCTDAVDREARLRLYRLTHRRVGLSLPPGESARLNAAELAELRRALSAIAGPMTGGQW